MVLTSLLLCLFYQDVFPEPLLSLQISMFSGSVISEILFGPLMCKNGSMKRLSVDVCYLEMGTVKYSH